MREESHLNDMRAAIRGDFERLEERRGEQELMRIAEAEPEAPVLEQEPEPEPAPEPAPEPVPAPEPEAAQGPETAPEPEVELQEPDVVEHAPATEPELRGEAAQVEPRSWLDRLLGR